MVVTTFTFNDFYENTYILHDDSKECIIIDPGCSTSSERKLIKEFITSSELTPVMLVNTHCHIDHVLGNRFIAETYQLGLYAHEQEKKVLAMQPTVAGYYGINYDPSPEITGLLIPGTHLKFGNTTLEILYVPGHAPGHICLYNLSGGHLIAGDTLFRESIGRTDLPGGNYDQLIAYIRSELFSLPENTIVYSGHGETTTIGHEKKYNPFFREQII
jgi:hydroxyacylglutathione hydrolase